MLRIFISVLTILFYSTFIIGCSADKHDHNDSPQGKDTHEHDRDAHKHDTNDQNNHEHDHNPDEQDHDRDTHEHDHNPDKQDHDRDTHEHDHNPDKQDHDRDTLEHDHNAPGKSQSHNHKPDQGHSHNQSNVQSHAVDLITFSAGQAKKANLENALVIKQDFNVIIKTSGEVMPAPGDEIIISAKTDGIVFFMNKKLLAGKKVNKGEPLFSISGGGLIENNPKVKFQQAESSYEKAKRDFERSEDLLKNKIISEREYLEAKTIFEKAGIIFRTISKNYRNGGDRLAAPESGFIKSIFVAEGQYIAAGQPVASIAMNKRLVVMAEVSQKHFSELAGIFSANFTTPYNSKTYDIKDLNGKLISYGRNTDKSCFFTPVYFEIDNASGIIPGSYIEIYLKANPVKDAVVIPETALMEQQDNYFVFVRRSEETYEKRYVEPGDSDGVNVRILSGVNEGEEVVTKGAYRIKLASMSNVMPAKGHVH